MPVHKRLRIYAKTFYYAGCYLPDPETGGTSLVCSSESIFQLSNRCWSTYTEGRSPYTYDGLIYTPMENGVGSEPCTKFKIDMTTAEFEICECGHKKAEHIEHFGARRAGKSDWRLLPGTTWNSNLKWKPPHENTIDFFVKLERKPVFRKGATVIERDLVRTTPGMDLSTEIDSYKTLHLYVGGVMNTTSCNTRQSFQRGMYEKILFRPTFPSDPDAYKLRYVCREEIFMARMTEMPLQTVQSWNSRI